MRKSRGNKIKKVTLLIIAVIILTLSIRADSCVGRILNIGIVNSVNENLLAELISVLLDERTGTTVNVTVFDSSREIYESVKKDDIGIVIENTDHALKMLNVQLTGDLTKDYKASKKAFREKLNLIWLKPFGVIDDEGGKNQRYYSAVITEDVLINFPALPRVINKLKNISNDKRFGKVVKSARSGKKVKRAVRDFLRKKKLI